MDLVELRRGQIGDLHVQYLAAEVAGERSYFHAAVLLDASLAATSGTVPWTQFLGFCRRAGDGITMTSASRRAWKAALSMAQPRAIQSSQRRRKATSRESPSTSNSSVDDRGVNIGLTWPTAA